MHRHASIGLTAMLLLGSGAVNAQLVSNAGLAIQTNQSLVGVDIGNGITQSHSIISARPAGTPAIGVGALSGNPDHYGSAASVSALNSSRLLGVDGSRGPNGPGVSIQNPTHAPVLSSIGHR